MGKLRVEDLKRIKESMKGTVTLRDGDYRVKITVHMGTCGIAAGSRKVMSALMELVEKEQTQDVILTSSSCAGLCSREPMITVEIKGQTPVKYVDLDEEKANKVFKDHIIGGKVVEEYALATGSERVG